MPQTLFITVCIFAFWGHVKIVLQTGSDVFSGSTMKEDLRGWPKVNQCDNLVRRSVQ